MDPFYMWGQNPTKPNLPTPRVNIVKNKLYNTFCREGGKLRISMELSTTAIIVFSKTKSTKYKCWSSDL